MKNFLGLFHNTTKKSTNGSPFVPGEGMAKEAMNLDLYGSARDDDHIFLTVRFAPYCFIAYYLKSAVPWEAFALFVARQQTSLVYYKQISKVQILRRYSYCNQNFEIVRTST